MKVEFEQDYENVETSDYVKDAEIAISEQGIFVAMKIRDFDEPDAGYLDFHVSIPWQPLIEEGLIDLVDDCRGGHDRIVDIDLLTEARDEWIAVLEKFIERLRMVREVEV